MDQILHPWVILATLEQPGNRICKWANFQNSAIFVQVKDLINKKQTWSKKIVGHAHISWLLVNMGDIGDKNRINARFDCESWEGLRELSYTECDILAFNCLLVVWVCAEFTLTSYRSFFDI